MRTGSACLGWHPIISVAPIRRAALADKTVFFIVCCVCSLLLHAVILMFAKIYIFLYLLKRYALFFEKNDIFCLKLAFAVMF